MEGGPAVDEDTSDDERAHRRSIFQEVNARIDALGEHWSANELLVLCECGARTCTSRIELSRGAYQAMRNVPGNYLLATGHETSSDHVVEVFEGFVVAGTDSA
jgi:hypothetical protein